MANVLVFAETRGTALRKVALEAVTAARALADASGGGEVHAIIAGAPGSAAGAEQLGAHGADVVYVVEHAALATFERESIAATVAERAKQGSYRAVVLGFSSQGRDLGPRLAAKLDAPIAADVTEIAVSGDTVVVKHPGYANKVMLTLVLTGTHVVVSVRPGAVTAKESPKSARVERLEPALDPGAARVVVKEVVEGAKGRPDLGEAAP